MELDSVRTNSGDGLELTTALVGDAIGRQPLAHLEELPIVRPRRREGDKARFGHAVGRLVEQLDGDLEVAGVEGAEAVGNARGGAERGMRGAIERYGAVDQFRGKAGGTRRGGAVEARLDVVEDGPFGAMRQVGV